MKKQFTVYRAVEGISLNGAEWLLNDDNSLMCFNTKEDVYNFLKVENENELIEQGIHIQCEDEGVSRKEKFPKKL